jgi:predicted AAA+ superfamily ATPase
MKQIIRVFTEILRKRLDTELNFIQVVLGPRQVGKTTGLQQIVREWTGPSLMVTADEIAAPSADWITVQWHRARNLGDNALFIIDEVQKIPQWSSTVKYLFDQDRSRRKLKVVLLGSASLSLQQGLSESLAGRYEVISAHHWNLSECGSLFGWTLDEFLMFGGYPAASQLVEDVERWQSFLRNSIIEPVLIKDILGLTTIGKPALFRQAFELSMAYPAQEISYQKLLGQLQESGNVTTIKHYLELLEGAFLLKTLQKYSGSAVRKKGSSPKILPLNTALIHAFRNPHDIETDPDWRGRVFEAAAGAALVRSGGELFYWRDGKFEVDFVLQLEGKHFAVEVKSGRKRVSRGMEKFLAENPECIPLYITYTNGENLLRSNKINASDLLNLKP